MLESEALFLSIFKQTSKFLKTIKFGNRKSMLVQAEINGQTYSFHHNVKINNKTKFTEYWSIIKDNIQVNFDKDYLIDAYKYFRVLNWNLDDVRNKNIIIQKRNKNITLESKWSLLRSDIKNMRKYSTYNSITPLNIKNVNLNPFLVFNKSLLNDLASIQINKIFVNDESNELFNYIYNYLINNFFPNLIEVLQDKNNNYIFIKIFNLTFLNSHRIFPLTEKELINLFKGKDLYESLVNAQKLYFDKYYT